MGTSSRPPPDLEDLDFDALVAPAAPAVAPRAPDARMEEEALIGERSLESAGYHVVMARARGARGGGKKLVMVVEDHDDTAELALRTLKNGGYATMRAAGSRECARLLATLGVPALILLDVELPEGLDGFDMLARFRAHPRLSHVPIVMFTARGRREDVLRGLALGADGYVVKPVKPAALLEVVGIVVGS